MWKIDWELLEKISPDSSFNRVLKEELIGDVLITEVNYDRSSPEESAGITSVSFKDLNGKIIASDGEKPFIADGSYFNDYVILSPKEAKALIEVKEDTRTGRNKEFYTFLGERYKTLREVNNAIESYAKTYGSNQTYYYEQHTVVEHSRTFEVSEKIVGDFDQKTLEKVNKILKKKGVDFTIKGYGYVEN